MNLQLSLVIAYSLIWIVLFGYVWNLIKKQKSLSNEIEALKSEAHNK